MDSSGVRDRFVGIDDSVESPRSVGWRTSIGCSDSIGSTAIDGGDGWIRMRSAIGLLISTIRLDRRDRLDWWTSIDCSDSIGSTAIDGGGG